jgi:hypothetical protein
MIPDIPNDLRRSRMPLRPGPLRVVLALLTSRVTLLRGRSGASELASPFAWMHSAAAPVGRFAMPLLVVLSDSDRHRWRRR